jgi:DNA-binding transcriptional ArsR family regulator
MPAPGADAPGRGRELDLTALRALAHPLRVRIIQELSNFGPLTSSGLAERLGESSGATSYHLRQLAKHDLIREVDGKGSARERWWRMSGDLRLSSASVRESPAGREATDIISREWQTENQRQVSNFSRFGREVLGPEWEDAAMLSTSGVRLTMAELRQVGDEFLAFLSDVEKRFHRDDDESAPDALPVQIQFNAFPLVDFASAEPPSAAGVAGSTTPHRHDQT